MTLKQFIHHDSENREIICWSRGRKVAERYKGNHYFILYQLDSFYVEIRFSKSHEEIIEFSAFEGTDELFPYLLVIDISELVGNI